MEDAFTKIKAFALGEDSAAATTTDQATAQKEKLAAQKLATQKLAADIRDIAQRTVDASWQRLEQEVQVQTLIWKSVAGCKKDGMGAKEQWRGMQLQAALREMATDKKAALLRVGEILQKDNGCLSPSMLKTLQSITRQTGLLSSRQQLANSLEKMEAEVLQTEADKAAMLKLVVTCRMATSLDSRVREALQLPPREATSASKENKKEVKKEEIDLHFKPLVIATPTRTLYEVVGMEGALGPKVSTRSSSSLAQSPWRPLSPEASAAKLRSMADAANLPAMWKKLQGEFDTQKLVWESVSLTKKKDTEIAEKIKSVKASLDRILTLASDSEQGAVSALEQLLARAEDLKLLNKSMSDTCQDVLKQHRLAPQRQLLARAVAERIDVSGVTLILPSTEAGQQELEKLVLSCELCDQLNYSVRKCLLLPVPRELEASLAAAERLMARRGSNASAGGAFGSRKSSKQSAIEVDKVHERAMTTLSI